MNGRLTLIRTCLSAGISVLALGGSIWLLHEGVQPPMYYWVLAVLAVTGVIGADAITTVRAIAGQSKINGTDGPK
jgi:hypothetical protein